MTRRVVITSTSVISSLGNFPSEIIYNLKNGNVVFERPSFDGTLTICPIKNFVLKSFTGRFKQSRYLNRGAEFNVAAASQLISIAGLSKEVLEKAGLFVGCGPNLDISSDFPEIHNANMDIDDLQALWILKFLPNTSASVISSLYGIHGENSTIATACSASLQAIGEAYRKIKHGTIEVAIAGGGDSRLNHGGLLAYKKANALWLYNENDYSPFNENNEGFVPGEGGAFFLLEELEHAKKSGREIICEICGFGTSMDGYNLTAPEPNGKWAEIAVLKAINESQITPSQVDLIAAHGTGTILNDIMEARLIDRLFSKKKPFVTALKSWIGHAAAGCGAIELAILLACLKENYIPEIRNLKKTCYDGINFVINPYVFSPSYFIIQNFGFGGQNSALLLKSWIK
ncbi:MAG: beta-ketoacyl-[acyl-carrier-protein] synthase family protein [Desulfobacterales bacterium]|nr:beta-ketoacyl-[acyl-carrier-protein] synthase family protein [Desulfobacterales bacterium]